VIKIGFTEPLTGTLAVEGNRELHGILAWQYYVNNVTNGIMVNGTRYYVQLVYYDDQSSNTQVTALYERLITQDKVDFLFTPYSSGLGFTAATVAASHGKLIVATGVASDTIWKQGYTNVIGTITPASKYLVSTIDLLKTYDPTAKNIAIVYSDDIFSAMCAAGAKNYSLQNGFNVVYYGKYPSTATDLSSVLTSVKATNPDAIIGGGHFADGVLLIKQAKQLNVNAKLFSILVATDEPAFYQSLGSDANYIMGPSQWEPDVNYPVSYGPSNQWFVSTYMKMFNNETPTYHSAEGFAAGLYLQAAIEKAQSLDTAKVRAAFNTLSLNTFFGPLQIDPATGIQVAHQMVIIQWQNGVKHTVWPPSAAVANPLYPKPPW
jgi:branched-chain amino acid transport system substrate-binding protein